VVAKYNTYKIEIIDSLYHCIEVNGQGTSHFIAPDTKSGIQKLYVVKDGKDICYVGITSQPMSSRLRGGFKDDGHYGYHGYKWKHLKEVELLTWTFPRSQSEDVEAVEAELVYFIREKTGKWPQYQMEIHFHHGASEKQRQIAESILSQCQNQ
jgi:hypothetical protein